MCPLFKKPLLDPTVLDNFYPVLHLPILGKAVETVVELQLQRIMNEMDYLDPFWSGTKTALVTLLDDLWQEQNGDNASILAFLDLFMAFDTLGPTWEVGGWWHNSVLIHLFPLRSVPIGIGRE